MSIRKELERVSERTCAVFRETALCKKSSTLRKPMANRYNRRVGLIVEESWASCDLGNLDEDSDEEDAAAGGLASKRPKAGGTA